MHGEKVRRCLEGWNFRPFNCRYVAKAAGATPQENTSTGERVTELETRLLAALGLILLASNYSLVDKQFMLSVLRSAGFDDETIIRLYQASRKRVLEEPPKAEKVAA